MSSLASVRVALLFSAFLGVTARSLGQVDAARPSVPVRVDPRIELISLIFRLAGNPEYTQGKVPAYTEAVEAQFGGLRDHAAVRRARELRRRRGVSYDACMSLAIHLQDVETMRTVVPLDPRPEGLDGRWQPAEAAAFVEDARRFVEESKFLEFFARHGAMFRAAEQRMREVLKRAELKWFDQFFGERPSARFEVLLGMLNGGSCYGPRVALPGDSEALYCVLGVWAIDDEGAPRFDASMIGTVVHEFCHSYCNRLVDDHRAALEGPGKTLWPMVADAMRAQAYGNWETMMRESLVRASVVRYMSSVEGDAAGAKEILRQHGRQFRWVGELSHVLAEYEKERAEHATLETFFPRIVTFFQGYAAKAAEEDAKRPKVVTLEPANGAQGVDPKTTEIRVVFDRPMLDKAWAVVGGGPHFPETTGRPSYDASKTVLTIPVKLKPNWSYELWLNRGIYNSFQSAERVRLSPVRVRFTTGS